MKKTVRKLLAVATSLALVMNMLPMSAFAEASMPVGAFADGDHPATGTDVFIENAPGEEELTTEEAVSPSASEELPGSQGLTAQSGEDSAQGDNSGGEDKGQDDTTGSEGATVGDSPAPTPSANEQGTPPAAPQADATSTPPQTDATSTTPQGDAASAAPHAHEFGTEWQFDDAAHWHECTAGDGEKADEAAHAFGEWATVKEATETEPGSRERTCTVCGYAETEAIPATGATSQRTLLGAQGSVDIDEANFPDANFRWYVKDDFDRDGNNVLSEAEVAAVTQMDCIHRDIQSLKGVEHFTALEGLYCWNNRLTSLDVSKNSALKVLYCGGNTNLSSLSLSPGIKTLRCENAVLSSLDVSGCPDLESLVCSRNHISSLDVSKNNALKVLEVNNNSLSSLDISNNALLQDLRCEINNLSSLDIGGNPGLVKLHCYGNQLASLDVSAAAALNSAVETGTHTSGTDYDQYSAAGAELRVDANVELTSVPITHTVTFDIVNGKWGDGTTRKTVTLPEGYPITGLNIPSPQPDEGFGVGAWDVQPVGKTVSGDVTYTWTYTHYKVSYVLVNDDASIGTVPADTGTVWWSDGRCEVVGYDAAQARPTLLDDRYDFDGWYTDQACDQIVDAWAALTGDVTLYGKWTGPFTVIDQVQLGFTLPTVGDPIPTGQYFAFSDAGSRPADLGVTQPSSMDDKTLVVFAAYELDGSEGNTFKAGKTYTLRVQVGPAYPPTQRFKGHTGGEAYALTVTGTTGSTIVVSPTLTEVNLSVTPVPVQRTVTVNTDPAEGGTVTGGGTVAEGQETTVTATANEGYAFAGWWDGEDNVSWSDEYTIPAVTGDLALIAKFVKTWTVTMDMNGGTIGGASSSTMDFEDGHVDQLPTAEDMEEWIADGTWITGPANSEYIGAEITDASGTKTYRPGDAYTVVSDATIKVLWKSTVTPPAPPATHTISYDLNGGTLGGKTGTVTVEAEEGSTITLPAPTREGYIFDYWEGSRYNAGDSYVVKGDHAFTARWKENAAPVDDADAGKGGSDTDDGGKESENNAGDDNGEKDGAGKDTGDGKHGGGNTGNGAASTPGNAISGNGSTGALGSATNGTSSKNSATGTANHASSTASTKSTSPNTGDHPLHWSGLMLLAGAGLLLAGITRRRMHSR